MLVDLISPKGHYKYNLNLINSLVNNNIYIKFIGDINLITWLKKQNIDNRFVEFESFETSSHIFLIRQFSHIRQVKKSLAGEQYKALICTSYHTITLGIHSKKYFDVDRVLLFNHNNLNELSSFLKKKLFHSIYKKFNIHIVFENEFKESLERKYNKKLPKVRVLPHFVESRSSQGLCKKQDVIDNKINMLYIGNDRGNKGLDTLIESVNQLNSQNIKLKRIELVVSGALSKKYNMEQIIFRNSRLSDQEYKAAIENADFIILPYKSTFNNRVSGIFFNALTARKPVIVSNIRLFKHYFKKFGVLGYTFEADNPKKLAELLIEIDNYYNESKYKEFTENLQKMRGYYNNTKIERVLIELIQQSE